TSPRGAPRPGAAPRPGIQVYPNKPQDAGAGAPFSATAETWRQECAACRSVAAAWLTRPMASTDSRGAPIKNTTHRRTTRPAASLSVRRRSRLPSKPSLRASRRALLVARMSRMAGGRAGGGRGRLRVDVAHDPHLLGGEGALPAHVAGEGEPPAHQGAGPVAVAGEETDVDEQPDDPPGEPGELQASDRDHGAAAREVGGRSQVVVAERLGRAAPRDLTADPAPGVEARLHSHLGDAGQLVQAHHVPSYQDIGMAGNGQIG